MEQEFSASLLWADSPAVQQGRPARISRGDLVAAGIGIADDEGVDAVTMLRVGSSVGVTKMALYRHVPSRAALVALMIDEAIGPPPALDSESWRNGVIAWVEAMTAVFAAHPWLLDVTLGTRMIGPNELGWFEAGLRALDTLPLDATERLNVLTAVNSQVREMVLQGRPGSRSELAAALADVLDRHEKDYPLTAAAFRDGTRSQQPREGLDAEVLAFGLARIIDGVDSLVASRWNLVAPVAPDDSDGGIPARTSNSHASGTFTVTSFTATDVGPEPAIETGVPVSVSRMEKRFDGDISGRSATLFTAAFDQAAGTGTYIAMESFEGTVNGAAGSFAFAHSATTTSAERQPDDREREFFVIVPRSGTGDLAGLAGTGEIVIDADGTHRVRLDYRLERP